MIEKRVVGRKSAIQLPEVSLRPKLRGSIKALQGEVSSLGGIQGRWLTRVVEPCKIWASHAHRLGQLRNELRGNSQAARVNLDAAIEKFVDKRIGSPPLFCHPETPLQGRRCKRGDVLNI